MYVLQELQQRRNMCTTMQLPVRVSIGQFLEKKSITCIIIVVTFGAIDYDKTQYEFLFNVC